MTQIAILASGMVTAVGFNSLSSCAAMRAGIRNIEELYLADIQGTRDFLRGGKVNLPQRWDAIEKLMFLAAPAIHECLLKVPTELRHSVPILLGVSLPETQFLGNCVENDLMGKIENQLKIPHHPKSKIFAYGQTSGIHALVDAASCLSLETPYCIVAGVDSYIQRKTIDHYVNARRVITEYNSNGFFPGEAGAAVLVSSSNIYPDSTLQIIGLGQASEPAPINSGKPFMAQGLTEAIRKAVSQSNVSLDKIACRLTDINGEYYKFNESNIAVARFSAREKEINMDICHPIEFVGEIGAAIIPLLLGLALDINQKGDSLGKYLLFHVGNDNEDRGALITRYGM